MSLIVSTAAKTTRKKDRTRRARPKPKRKAKAKGKGTERWPAVCEEPGKFITLPKVFIKRTGELGLRPNHVWLLLALQLERFRDRPPRHYWEELARWCGRDKNTVRRWAYELQEMGLLGIEQVKELEPGQERRPGHRNERNRFHLDRFEDRLEREQLAWDKKYPRKGGGRTEGEDG